MRVLLFVATALLAVTNVRGACNVVVFGDSTSDNGNAELLTGSVTNCSYTLTNGTITNYNGAYSDGPVWAETFTTLTSANSYNFAYGTAVSTTTSFTSKLGVPDLAAQISNASSILGTPGTSDIAIVWIGANDLTTSLAADPGLAINTTAQTIVVTASVTAIASGVATLASQGYQYIAVLSPLPGQYSPGFAGLIAGGLDLAGILDGYTTALMQAVNATAANFPNITIVTVNTTAVYYPIYEATYLNTTSGYSLGPCMIYNPATQTNICTNSTPIDITYCAAPETSVWYDNSHPSGSIHASLGASFYSTLASSFPSLNATVCNATNTTGDIIVSTNQTIGGEENVTGSTTYQATVNYTTSGTTMVTSSVTYSSTSSMVISSPRNFSGTATITFEAGATAVFNDVTYFMTSALVSFSTNTITSTAALFFSGGSLSMTTTTLEISDVVYFRNTANSLTGCTLSGSGSTTIDTAGAVVSSNSTVWSTNLSTVAISTAARRAGLSTYATSFNSATSVSWCNSDNGATTIATGTALIPDVSCTLAAATTYSSRATSITFDSGSYAQFTSVSSTALPVYAEVLSATDLIVEAVATGVTGAFEVNLLEYGIGSLSSCYTSFNSISIDGCATDYSCTITGAANSGNSSLCQIVFTQAAVSPSPSPASSTTDDSNDGLYSLFALFAVPVSALIGLAIMKFCKAKPPAPVELETVAYPSAAYPSVAYPGVAYPSPIPSPAHTPPY